jgi:filamentous hemagglutinin family protein
MLEFCQKKFMEQGFNAGILIMVWRGLYCLDIVKTRISFPFMNANAAFTSTFIRRLAVSLAGIACMDQIAIAQVVPDRTLTSPSLVRTSGSTATINGGTTAGTNLFHSFSQFSIPSGTTAFFNNNLAIDNIIARVTGGSFSSINGRIRANGAANLFLINPNGILFGPNASLNIGGSFVASTANSFTFADGFQYSATNPQTVPLLSINVPVGLQYGKVAQPITVIGSSLSVKSSKTVALVGGDVSLNKAVFQPFGGRIELGGLAESGTVGLTFVGNTPSLNFPADALRSNVSIDKSTLTVAGLNGGDIFINAENINISDSFLLAGIFIGAGGQAGDIALNAKDKITISASGLLSQLFDGSIGTGGDITIKAKSLSLTGGSVIDTNLSGQGKAGNINIAVDSLFFQGGAQIRTDNSGTGDAGDIKIIATNVVALDGTDLSSIPSGMFSSISSGATGNGGNISVATDSLLLTNGGKIGSSFYGQGQAGNIAIKANKVILDGADAQGSSSGLLSTFYQQAQGDGGNISISTQSLTLTNGAAITSFTFGKGNAGNLILSVKDLIFLDGMKSFITSSSSSTASGDSGDISISAKTLKLDNGAFVSNLTFGQGNSGNISIAANDKIELNGAGLDGSGGISIFVDKSSVGNGGRIDIFTGTLSVKNGAVIGSGSGGKGTTGDINITASDSIRLDGFGLGPSSINNFPFSLDEGGAGNITLDTKTLWLTNGAVIAALQTGSQKTGNIDIIATDSVNILGASQAGSPSRITSTTITNLPSGDITIRTPILNIVDQRSSAKDRTGITAQSAGIGDAGDIAINAGTVTVDGGEIAASMGTRSIGDGGSITITGNILTALNGGNIRTTTSSKKGGDAGSIKFFLADSLNITGDGSGVFANTGINSTGNGGNIFIDPPTVTITDGAAISVNSLGSGTGGSVTLRAGSLTLDNGTISAATASSNGGNVNLGVQNLLLANNNSTISATAGGIGNGGNLDIDAGFIVLNNNSDIAANAFQGQGGNIQIVTQGLFQSRDSTITASSDLGINGTVQLNVTDLDPSRGLFSLPETVVDASGLVAQKCDATVDKVSRQSEFVVTGRGGLQPNPSESLQGESVLSNWVTLQPHSAQSSKQPSVTITPSAPTTDTITIAQGWKTDSDGTVVLTAEPSGASSISTWQPSVKCRA